MTVTTDPSPGHPRRVPPIGRDLTEAEELACAFRILAREGFSENLAGHISWIVSDDGSMRINPWGMWWDEVKASDICLVDADGAVIEGRWEVPPAIPIHTELHRARPDARVVIHNHPYWVTVLAAVGMLPEILHQNASLFDGDLAFVEEYTGAVEDKELGQDLASRIGDAKVVVLASHGVVVTGENLPEATYRAATIDRLCRLNYDVALIGRPPIPIDAGLRRDLRQSLLANATEAFWAGAVRRILRDQPDVLD